MVGSMLVGCISEFGASDAPLAVTHQTETLPVAR